jgi:hypothetical protein
MHPDDMGGIAEEIDLLLQRQQRRLDRSETIPLQPGKNLLLISNAPSRSTLSGDQDPARQLRPGRTPRWGVEALTQSLHGLRTDRIERRAVVMLVTAPAAAGREPDQPGFGGAAWIVRQAGEGPVRQASERVWFQESVDGVPRCRSVRQVGCSLKARSAGEGF